MLSAGLAAMALPALIEPAAAQDADAAFKGKQIRLIVGSAPGGGYDAYGRLVAAHLNRHIPGEPTIIVQHMPGAGSLVLANHLANVAPSDGTVIAAVNPLIATHPLFYPDRSKFDPRKMGWIGSVLKETHVGTAWHTTPIKTFKDVFQQELVVAGSGGSTDSYPTFAKSILGTRFKVVSGYSGTKEGMLAMERGEVGGVVGITWASLKATSGTWLNEGKIRVFVQFSLARHPELPNVPWIYDFARNDEDRAAMNLMFATQELGRPFVAPPGLPENTLRSLRGAFDAMVKDPEFLAEAQRRKLDIDPTSGVAIQSIVGDIYKTPPAIVARVRDILGDQAAR